MNNLISTLRLASNALRVQGQALALTSQNLAYMGTPGYAKQVANFTDTVGGGVRLAPALNTRNNYSEQTVRAQRSLAGGAEAFDRLSQGVAAVLGLDDVTGQTGLNGALRQLFSSLTKWSTNPGSDIDARSVLTSARQVAATFGEIGQFLSDRRGELQQAYRRDVDRVNELVGQARKISAQMGGEQPPDPVLDAQLHGALEELSSYVPILATRSENGHMEISLGGTIPLLSGSHQFPLAATLQPPAADAPFPGGAPQLRLLDSEGNDITGSVSSGKLHGDLEFANRFLPSLIGDGQQQGDLNRLAQGLADSMNRELGGSVRLFDYDASNPGAAAATLRVNESISSSDLLSLHISQGGTLAARLAAIPGGANPDDELDGAGYRDFLAGLQKSATGELAANSTSLDLHTRLLNQAESLRQEIQGVSLEEEAVNLLTYQRGFEAMAKVIGVVNEMTQTALALFS